MRFISLILISFFALIDCNAQEIAFDQGTRDTLSLNITSIDDGQADLKLKLEAWIFSDETIVAFTGGFNWDNPKVILDSAHASPLLRGKNFGIFLFDNDDFNTSRANRVIQLGGYSSGNDLEGSSVRRLWATYYFTLTDWQAGDSVEFDTLSNSDYELMFVTPGPFYPQSFEPFYPGPMKYSGVETGILEPNNNLPKSFVLYQNFPNPFNPETVIQFELLKSSSVELSVYNTIGQEVASIYYGHLSVGKHQFNWNGLSNSDKEMPSGVYLYRLEAGEFSETKKMVLLR